MGKLLQLSVLAIAAFCCQVYAFDPIVRQGAAKKKVVKEQQLKELLEQEVQNPTQIAAYRKEIVQLDRMASAPNLWTYWFSKSLRQ